MAKQWIWMPLVAALAACGTGEGDRGVPVEDTARTAGDSAAAPVPAMTVAPAATAADGPALTGEVVRLGEGRYRLSGRTPGVQTLELSVEDGHDVLYGPVEVPVTGGAFQAEIELEPTRMPRVFAYLTEPAGTRQWVVPIPLDSARVAVSVRAEAGSGGR